MGVFRHGRDYPRDIPPWRSPSRDWWLRAPTWTARRILCRMRVCIRPRRERRILRLSARPDVSGRASTLRIRAWHNCRYIRIPCRYRDLQAFLRLSALRLISCFLCTEADMCRQNSILYYITRIKNKSTILPVRPSIIRRQHGIARYGAEYAAYSINSFRNLLSFTLM